ncbi:hypothetical protein D3C72_1315340 [compost metagenome]
MPARLLARRRKLVRREHAPRPSAATRHPARLAAARAGAHRCGARAARGIAAGPGHRLAAAERRARAGAVPGRIRHAARGRGRRARPGHLHRTHERAAANHPALGADVARGRRDRDAGASANAGCARAGPRGRRKNGRGGQGGRRDGQGGGRASGDGRQDPGRHPRIGHCRNRPDHAALWPGVTASQDGAKRCPAQHVGAADPRMAQGTDGVQGCRAPIRGRCLGRWRSRDARAMARPRS